MTEAKLIAGARPDPIKKLADEWIESNYPEIWAAAYPRRYREPRCGRYHSPKSAAREIALAGIKFAHPRMIGRAEQYEFIAGSQLARFGVPIFWIGEEIAQAIRQTTPPGEIDLFGMHLPFEACAFQMPRGSLSHATEGEIAFVSYSRMRANDFATSKLAPTKRFGTVNNCMIVLASSASGILWHWNLPEDYYHRLTLPEIDASIRKFNGIQSSTVFAPRTNAEMNEADAQLGVETLHYIFGALFLMEERPDLITRGSLEKRVPAKASGRAAEYWSPNVLGEFYRIKREPTPHQGGSHSSPRLHWVRGFYREQRHGVGRTLSKRIWIEPFLRGIEP